MAKGRIRTTMQKDYFGTGNEKEITMDDGRTYRIKSTMQKDYFGDGQELEIYEVGNTNNDGLKIRNVKNPFLSLIQKIFAILSILIVMFPIFMFLSGLNERVSDICAIIVIPGLCWFILPFVFIILADVLADVDYKINKEK